MCGICGIITRTDQPPRSPEEILAMMAMLSHRGPDGGGYYRDKKALLGHTRLSIIDLETGTQPLSNEDGSIWISFNGEIFNYLELTEELRRHGHVFRSHSDTETIIHAWEQWGPECFSRFNGQWALALWDANMQRLVLSRDRLGIRPLYYAYDNAYFSFASEIKALLTDPQAIREFDADGFNEICTLWGPRAPRTAFKGIHELEPGYTAIVDKDTFTKAPYWSIEFPRRGSEKAVSFEDAAEELRQLLTEAARLRFTRSDVPVGAYLSGGIDSSIITTIVSRYTPSRLKTFSITFSDPEFNEETHQKLMADNLGTDHESIRISDRDIGEVFPEVVYHAERPLLRSAPAPMFLLSRLVRNAGYKVVVTGEGSDEVFAGYDIFRELHARLFMLRDPGSERRKEIVYSLYPWLERSPNKIPAFAQAFFGREGDADDPGLSHRIRWSASRPVLRLFSPGFLERMVSGDPADRLIAELPAESAEWSALSRAQWIEMKTLLPGYILSAQGDRMLMANSVEGRFPYLDVNVLEFAASLPGQFKLFELEGKHILKRAFKGMIPDTILSRPKQPYRAPDGSSFFSGGSMPGWLIDLLAPDYIESTGLFRTADVVKLAAKCRESGGMRMSNMDNLRIVTVISTLILHEKLIASRPSHRWPSSLPLKIIDRVQRQHRDSDMQALQIRRIPE